MIDRYYKKNTRSTFKSVRRWLSKLGYKETCYGDSAYYDNVGYAFMEKPGRSLKLTYYWIPNPKGRGVISGKMISLEDYTSCFSMVMGKETGYK